MRKFIFCLSCLLLAGWGVAVGQTVKITGTVISDEDREPLIGASVVIKGSPSVGTLTDVDGNFSLDAPAGTAALVVSYVGMTAREVAVTGKHLSIVLSSSLELEEVVVTALGISREKKALGYAVSEVKGDEMVKSRGGVSNPVNALQGKVAGLQIASGSGSLGGSSKILIRGVSSLSGNNQPLFVIDGVPVEGKDFNDKETARGAEGYDYGNLIQDINPDDVESISVLKGPNASALYGSRANNGVIMITTKKGTADAAGGYGVSFNTAVGFEKVNKLPKLQKAYGGGYGGFATAVINGQPYRYADLATDESWGPKYDGQPYMSWYDLAKWEAGGMAGNPSTSTWQTPVNDVDAFFETGVSFTNNVSISQATERSAVRISYTNTDLKGYLPKSALSKNVLNVSASTASADKKLEVFTNLTYFNSRAKGRSETGYGDNNVMVKFIQWGHRELDMKELKALYMMPNGTQATWNRSDYFDSAGNFHADPTPAYSNNPYWTRNMNWQNDTRNRLYGNIGFSYKILPELKFQFRTNLDFFVDKQYERNAVHSQEQSRYKEVSRQQYELNNEFLLSYNKQLNETVHLSANAGVNLMKNRYEEVYGETEGGLSIPLLYNLKNSVSAPIAYNDLTKKAIHSAFANVTLGWRSMAYVDASLRNDRSSTLPKNNNSYFYPSLTGSFIFSELLKEHEWLSFGKVRLGYAIVGNDTDPYQVTDTYNHYTRVDAPASTSGYVLNNRLKNPSLKPESTHSYEAGLEMSFLGNRAGFDVTVYAAETRNQIIPLGVSGSTGYIEQVINAGLITNRGVEASIFVSPVSTRTFKWDSRVTLASNRNKVVDLIEGVNYYPLARAPFSVEVGAVKGAAYGIIMGTDYIYDEKTGKRVITEDGLYASTNGNVNIGKVFPDFTGGWLNTFTYRNFDLSVLLDFSKGGHYFSTSYMWGIYSGMLEESAANGIRENGILLDGVQADGTPNRVTADGQVYCEDFYTGPAAQNVLRSDYLKLREVNAGYTFPLKKGFVKSLRISGYGRNLGVWGPDTKHFDPEMIVTNSGNVQGIEGGAVASVANYGINLSVKF
jgi:TonB-linked SusC/RagA family outer membrane protein